MAFVMGRYHVVRSDAVVYDDPLRTCLQRLTEKRASTERPERSGAAAAQAVDIYFEEEKRVNGSNFCTSSSPRASQGGTVCAPVAGVCSNDCP